jgi:hypothetical protein
MQEELTTIAPAYENAVQMQNRLAEIQNRLSRTKASAELYTYLRHPWPRTQLLSALMTSLPDEVAFQQVQILREIPAPSSPAEIQPPVDKKAEDEKLKSLAPAEQDLVKLRRRLDPMQTTIVLAGTVPESSLLHQYMGDLEALDIFEKAELDCVNSVENNKGGASFQFRAVLAVQPGYGQPGGPKGDGPDFRISKNGTVPLIGAPYRGTAKAASRNPRHGGPQP